MQQYHIQTEGCKGYWIDCKACCYCGSCLRTIGLEAKKHKYNVYTGFEKTELFLKNVCLCDTCVKKWEGLSTVDESWCCDVCGFSSPVTEEWKTQDRGDHVCHNCLIRISE